ncbi:MAG: OmpA family protein [Alphaproteobacteria bacterium]|nr:OmpA family protein [Alphaproteobacteria bacterium]
MRILLGLVVWGVGIGALGLLAQSDHAKRIETAIAQEAIESASQSVHTIKTKVSGRDILVSGMADSETERDHIVAALSRVRGNRVVVSQLNVLERAEPYQFSGKKSEDGITYEGNVPTSTARLEFAAKLGTAKLHRAAGMPDRAWPRAVFQGVAALQLIREGDFELSGRTMTMTGKVLDLKAERKLRKALARLPHGYSVNFELEIVDDGLPAQITLDFHAEEGARVSGKAPSGLATIHLAGALGLSKLGGKIDASPRDGKAPIAAKLKTIGPWLPLFERLVVKAGQDYVIIDGELGRGSDLELIREELTEAFGENVAITLVEAPAKSKDGIERVNVATGKHEVLRNGYWFPVVDFTVSREACEAGTNAILQSEHIDFVPGSKRLGSKSVGILNDLAATLKHCLRDRSLFVEIGGHTNGWGDNRDNLALSIRRAGAVAAALTARGVTDKAMIARGYGATQPVITTGSADGRAAKQRTTITWFKS